jgi:hypothetical protein
MKKGDLSNWEILMDRAYGKPEKTINHGLAGISPETMAKLDAVFAGTEKPKGKPKPAGKKPVKKRKNEPKPE